MRKISTATPTELWQAFVDKIRDAGKTVQTRFTMGRPCPTPACRDHNHPRSAHGRYGCMCAVYDAHGNHDGWCICARTYV